MNPIKAITQEISDTVEHFRFLGKIASKHGLKEALDCDISIAKIKYHAYDPKIVREKVISDDGEKMEETVEISKDAYNACTRLFQVIPEDFIEKGNYAIFLKTPEGAKFLKTLLPEQMRPLVECEEKDVNRLMNLYVSRLF